MIGTRTHSDRLGGMGARTPMSDMTLLRENTEPLVVCKELFSFWRLREPWHEIKSACRRHTPHDGLPHVTYIDGVGWYEWDTPMSDVK